MSLADLILSKMSCFKLQLLCADTACTPLHNCPQNGYDHYMQKEIHEQPKTLADTMRGRLVINKPLTPMSSARPSFSNLGDLDSEDASQDSTPKARPLTQVRRCGVTCRGTGFRVCRIRPRHGP